MRKGIPTRALVLLSQKAASRGRESEA
jgi:hypothetical protein